MVEFTLKVLKICQNIAYRIQLILIAFYQKLTHL